ncbi:MAG: toll/interleukin-1 receptor domain-containing protein [Clostridiales bacterium]|nr:toll/interleukin-1 receptor domain-containing protein [Clostridiales bacterium]
MPTKIKYSAFISYRHCPPDREIAERLQNRLESFRLPKDVAKKLGRRRLGRVFRDETELSVSNDLSESIEAALKESKYLIAICSPQYLESLWCQKEIEAFLKYRDRSRILLVLADGEPETAFPKMLLDKEPLAADCRGADSEERKPKINKAVIQLAAAMLGLDYDDLEQRHRRAIYSRVKKRVFITFGIMAAIIAISIAFIVNISGKNAEIASQNDLIKLKYADTLAATSDVLLRDGKRKDAVYAARLGLPDERREDYSELATNALVNALGLYDPPNTFACDKDYLLTCSYSGSIIISPEGRYAGVKGLDAHGYIIDLDSGETLLDYEDSGFMNTAFDGENGFIYSHQSGNFFYYDLTTKELTDLGIDEAYLQFNRNGEGYAIVSDDGVGLYKGPELIAMVDYSNEGFSPAPRLDTAVEFVPGMDTVWVTIQDFDQNTTTAFIVDMQSGAVNRKELCDDGFLMDCYTDGNKLIWQESDGIDYHIYITDADLSGETEMIDVSVCDVYDLIVLGDDVVIVSENWISFTDSYQDYVTEMAVDSIFQSFVTDDGIILVDSSGGYFKIKDGICNYIESEVNDSMFAWERVYNNGKLYLVKTGDNHIYTYAFRQSEYLTLYDGDFESLWEYDEEAQRQEERFLHRLMQEETAYDESRVYKALLCGNNDVGLVQLWDGEVCIYDVSTLECLKTIYSIDGTINDFYYDEISEYYYISADSTLVYDRSFKNIYTINNCGLAGVDTATGNLVVFDYQNSDENDEPLKYLVRPVTYDMLITMADEYLNGYVPDVRVQERYSLS